MAPCRASAPTSRRANPSASPPATRGHDGERPHHRSCAPAGRALLPQPVDQQGADPPQDGRLPLDQAMERRRRKPREQRIAHREDRGRTPLRREQRHLAEDLAGADLVQRPLAGGVVDDPQASAQDGVGRVPRVAAPEEDLAAPERDPLGVRLELGERCGFGGVEERGEVRGELRLPERPPRGRGVARLHGLDLRHGRARPDDSPLSSRAACARSTKSFALKSNRASGATSTFDRVAALHRPRHERRAQAGARGSVEIVLVRGDHHHFAGREAEQPRRALVHLAVPLVVPEELRRQHAVPRQAAVLRHVGEQRDVAVRQRRDHELLLEPLQPGDRVLPRREAMPGAVEVILLGVGEPLDANRTSRSSRIIRCRVSMFVHGRSPRRTRSIAGR